jgi:hypothetical protein
VECVSLQGRGTKMEHESSEVYRKALRRGLREASEAPGKSFEFNLRGRADLFVCVAHRRQRAEEEHRERLLQP